MENFSNETPKERIEAFEALSKYDQTSSVDGAPNVYVRPDKEQEIDLLWQNFKGNSNTGKAPLLYLMVGFIVGALTVLIINSCVNSFDKSTDILTSIRKFVKRVLI